MSDSSQPPYGDPPPPPPQPLPGYGPPPGAGSGEPLPWLERERLGIAEALVETIKLVVTDPKGAFARVRADGDMVSPFVFALIVGWVMTLVGQMWGLLTSSLFSFGSIGLPSEFGDLGLAAGLTVGQAVINVILFPFFLAFGLLIGGGIYHLMLILLGGLDQSELRFEGTFKVLCYAQVASIANVVPFIGWLIGFLATLVLLVIGLEQVHRTTTAKAALAVAIPITLCCLCVIVVAITFGAAIAAGIAGAAGG